MTAFSGLSEELFGRPASAKAKSFNFWTSGFRVANRGGAEGAERIFMNGLTEKIIGAAIEVHKVLGSVLI